MTRRILMFDFDGTLADTMQEMVDAFAFVLDELHPAPSATLTRRQSMIRLNIILASSNLK